MSIYKTCKQYFNPSQLFTTATQEGRNKNKARLMLASYIFVLPPLFMSVLYLGSSTWRWLSSDDPKSKKVQTVSAPILSESTPAQKAFSQAKQAVLERIKWDNPPDTIKNLTMDQLSSHFKNEFAGLDDQSITFCLNLAYIFANRFHGGNLQSFLSLEKDQPKLNGDGKKYFTLINAVIAFAPSAPKTSLYSDVSIPEWQENFTKVRDAIERMDLN